jgi:Na+/H+-dicarboxylate symporter
MYFTVTCLFLVVVLFLLLSLFFISFNKSNYLGQIWGNLISSLVLSERDSNSTTEVTADALQKCGANNCPADDIGNNTNLKKPELKQVMKG